MVARALLPSRQPSDAGRNEAVREVRAEEQVVEPHALVVRPALAEVGPEGPERTLGMSPPQSVRPTLAQQSPERRTALRVQEGC